MSQLRHCLRAAVAAALLHAALAHANDLAVSLDAGTTGLGAHLTAPLAASVNVRAGMNYLSHSFERNVNGLDYHLKLKLHTVDLLADWYVIPASRFHVTGGAVYNGSKFDALALTDSSGNYRVNGRTYPGALVGKVFGKVDFRKTAPYLGIGWGNAVGPGDKWGFQADLGALFQGKANVRLSNAGCTAIAAACAQLASDVAAQQASLADDLDSFRVYPVVRVGVSYHF